jgi:hypothetical protein
VGCAQLLARIEASAPGAAIPRTAVRPGELRAVGSGSAGRSPLVLVWRRAIAAQRPAAGLEPEPEVGPACVDSFASRPSVGCNLCRRCAWQPDQFQAAPVERRGGCAHWLAGRPSTPA